VTNTWTAVPSMSTARYAPSAALLPSGKVLVAGGTDFANAGINTAELYDPVTNTWAPGGSFNVGRGFMTSALLLNGKMLFAGGYVMGAFSAATSIYDPATNTWSAAGSMNTQRVLAGAWTLPTGNVLVAGGANGDPESPTALATSEIYDPITSTWAAGPPMLAARWAFGFATLPGGGFIAAGGIGNPDPIAAVEIFDPVTGWSAAQPLSVARGAPPAALLEDGTFLVAGGESGTMAVPTFPTSSEIYSAATNTWSAAGSMGAGRYIAGATRLTNGEVLVAGGLDDTMGGVIANADRYGIASVAGAPCNSAAECASGFCVDGVCCLVAACSAADQCHLQGTCTAGTGVCSSPIKPDGSACDDGDACTQADTCQAGACTAGSPIACAPQDECHAAGVCDPVSGACNNPVKPDGSPCTGGTCQGGSCMPATTGTGSSGGVGGTGGGGGGGAGGTGGGGGAGSTIGGCGCRVAGREGGSIPAGALGAALLALALATRRRGAAKG
jgi:MYXO-CTERM domain-containing protein